ncbi:MAG TPA: hypothetical protein VGF53_08065 [Pseudolabrys sp.]
MSWLYGWVLGIASSVIGAYVVNYIEAMRLAKAISIEGTWAELIPGSLEPSPHQYSLGHIYFDKRRKIYACDGTNYLNDGAKFCHWSTITSHIDTGQRKFFYTFATQMDREPGVTYYGFGVIDLESRDGKLVPAAGYYVSANVDGKPMSHTIFSLPLQYSRKTPGSQVIHAIQNASK